MKAIGFVLLCGAIAPLGAMRDSRNSINPISQHINIGDDAGALQLINSNPELLLPENWGCHCPWDYALREGFYHLICRMIDACKLRGYDLKKIALSACREPQFGAETPLLHNVVEQSSADVIQAKFKDLPERMISQIMAHQDALKAYPRLQDPVLAIQLIIEDFISFILSIAPEVVFLASEGSDDTGLHVAAREGSYRAMELILKAGGCSNSQNYINETALHLCVTEKRPVAFIKLLLSYGALANVLKNRQGLTAVQSAQRLGLKEHVQAMQSRDIACGPHIPAYIRTLQLLNHGRSVNKKK